MCFVVKKISSHPFISFKKTWVISDDTWFKLGQCKALIKSISTTPKIPEYLDEIYNINLVKGAHATTAIEGNTLTEEEIFHLQKGKKLPPSKKYMEIEVKNVLHALNKLRDEIIFKKKSTLISAELLKKFHKLIGKGLGEYFDAIPGKFRTRQVVVGNKYKAPDHKYINQLVKSFCEWSKKYFHYQRGQTFSSAIIQAIVSHIYIAWIHPFSDGNGRTARLLEFFLLLRAGVPDIAAHILSNFYNETRNEYYNQLEISTHKGGELTAFIEYAVQGFKDGLQNTLNIVQKNQLQIAWNSFVHEVFQSSKNTSKTKVVNNRRLSLMLSFELDKSYTEDELLRINESIRITYQELSTRTLARDLEALINMELLLNEKGNFRANSNILKVQMASIR
jgi:Fic family protein